MPGSALGSCPTARQGCGWEASAAIAAVALWGHRPEVSTGWRPLQGNTSSSTDQTSPDGACLLYAEAPYTHVPAAECKSFVHRGRFFSPYPFY